MMKQNIIPKIKIEILNDSFINKVANLEFKKLDKNTQKRIVLISMILKLQQINKESLIEKELINAVQEFIILCGLEVLTRKGLLKGKGYGFDRKYIETKSKEGK